MQPIGWHNESSKHQEHIFKQKHQLPKRILYSSALHPPDASISRVWKALTTSEGLALWLMPNDFQPVVGAQFTFKAGPQGDWNGIVECRVTELEVASKAQENLQICQRCYTTFRVIGR